MGRIWNDGLLRRVGNLAKFGVMVKRDCVGRSGPVPMWRVWLVGLVVAVVAATAVAAAWHEEHGADPSCIVCKLTHQPLAEVSGDLQLGPGDAPEPVTGPSVSPWIAEVLDAHVPARAPPLS